ncbi:dynein heavy chain 12, axonemal [Eurytemora carolleeae]|uniref:dynein heavy chain 12, axonemal n=1 Tax=Eurytemora carolleeae TaxID=1294199 RepID=UPI000C777A02|nr:dynein heavy chain 12, axonemal [Eurytemora carolleeae]|eukprot:XP_023332854.1 dynein heavy chain 12, axonemal-like [Eurytemora affinis]
MLVRNPEEEKREKEKVKQPLKRVVDDKELKKDKKWNDNECEKTEETLLTSWYPAVTSVFNQSNINKGLKGERLKSFYIFQGERLKSFYIFQGERLKSFYSCVSALLSIQLRDLLMRSITSYVQAFQDHRTLPRIEMELVLSGKRIEFSPTCTEVTDMIVSVVQEMNKLLREVPTIQSWISGSSNQFVPVTLNKEPNLIHVRVYTLERCRY